MALYLPYFPLYAMLMIWQLLLIQRSDYNYADILLYRIINTSDDSKLLQDNLDTLLNWSKTWQMSFNPSECIHLKVTNKHSLMPTSYYLDEYNIQHSQSATYLGVTIDQKLKWSEYIVVVPFLK